MENNTLVLYFTRSGNTQRIAELIQKNVGGAIQKIEPKDPYPAPYKAIVEQAKKEIQANYQPALESKIEGMDAYKTVFIGTPNWWSTMAPPIVTFLSEYDLSGKTVVPFCTHGGGGEAHVLKDIAKMCPDSTILRGFCVYGDGGARAQRDVAAWLEKIGITKE